MVDMTIIDFGYRMDGSGPKHELECSFILATDTK